MFEATSSSLPDLDWEKTLNENDRKLSYATFTQVLQQVRACAGGVGSKWLCMLSYVGVTLVSCGFVWIRGMTLVFVEHRVTAPFQQECGCRAQGGR